MNFDRLKTIYDNNKYGILPITPGMVLEIHEKVWEGDTKRILKFKGLVIKLKKPSHPDGTFTIRGEAARMTVEKIYPLSFPNFDKVLLMDDYKIRRSKLYYIRTKIGKDARFKSIIENGKKGMDLLEMIKNDTVEEIVETNNNVVDTKKEAVDVKEEVVDVKEEATDDTNIVEETKE